MDFAKMNNMEQNSVVHCPSHIWARQGADCSIREFCRLDRIYDILQERWLMKGPICSSLEPRCLRCKPRYLVMQRNLHPFPLAQESNSVFLSIHEIFADSIVDAYRCYVTFWKFWRGTNSTKHRELESFRRPCTKKYFPTISNVNGRVSC